MNPDPAGILILFNQPLAGGTAAFSESDAGVLREVEAVETALRRDATNRNERQKRRALEERLERLTKREQQVMALVVTGRLNKQIATELGIKEKTVKIHRGRVMDKLEVGSLAELVRLATRAGLVPG